MSHFRVHSVNYFLAPNEARARNQDKIAGGQPFICHSEPAINARIFFYLFAQNVVNRISLLSSKYRVRHAGRQEIRGVSDSEFQDPFNRRAFKSDPHLECEKSDHSDQRNKNVQWS